MRLRGSCRFPYVVALLIYPYNTHTAHMHTPVFSGGLFPSYSHISTPIDPVYEALLSRASAIYHSTEVPRCLPLVLPTIQLLPFSAEQVIWRDFDKYAQALSRPIRHIIAFFVSIWGFPLHVDNTNLVLSKTVKPEILKRAIKDYMEKYVLCKACKGLNTELIRDTRLRRYRLECKECWGTWPLEVLLKGGHQGMKAERQVLSSSS